MPDQAIDPQRYDEIVAENARLNRAVFELSFLNDLAREISSSFDPQDVMQKLISRSLRAVNATQGVITLTPGDKKKGAKTLVRSIISSTDQQFYQVDQVLLGWMLSYKKPLLILDPGNDERFKGIKWDEKIRSVLCVPLLLKSELIGVLTVFNKKGGGSFTEEDQRLMAILAAQSAQVVENARLHDEEHKFRRMLQELELASEIQQRMLPKSDPQVDGYDIKGLSLPAQEVGGDYYDFINQDTNHLALCLGDISGKGLPAALLMSNLQATVRSQALSKHPPVECLGLSNKLLFQSTAANKFATLFYGQLHLHSHEFNYGNAGHNRPFLVKANGVAETLQTADLALGLIGEVVYREDNLCFEPGDMLVIYSDGITEAIDALGDQFGEQRLLELIKMQRQHNADKIVTSVFQAVKDHIGGTTQEDDMTLVIIKRKEI